MCPSNDLGDLAARLWRMSAKRSKPNTRSPGHATDDGHYASGGLKAANSQNGLESQGYTERGDAQQKEGHRPGELVSQTSPCKQTSPCSLQVNETQRAKSQRGSSQDES